MPILDWPITITTVFGASFDDDLIMKKDLRHQIEENVCILGPIPSKMASQVNHRLKKEFPSLKEIYLYNSTFGLFTSVVIGDSLKTITYYTTYPSKILFTEGINILKIFNFTKFEEFITLSKELTKNLI